LRSPGERKASVDRSNASYRRTYSWATEAPGEKATFDAETMTLLRRISDLDPDTHKWRMQPPGGNILQVNRKAQAWRATTSSCGSGRTRRRSERSFHSMRRSERDHHFFDAHGPRRRLNVWNGSGS
jgi:hypothetical protein